MNRYVTALLAAAVLALHAGTARADRYRVDLIVYQDDTGSGSERPVPARTPDLQNTFDPGDPTQLRAAGIELLPDDAFGLASEWRHLANSKRHRPLMRLAWLQKDPPSSNGPGLRLRSGSPLDAAGTSIYPIDGSVRLLMGRFLHLEASLAYTIRTSSGQLASYTLNERRRMRRKETHHLDSPRLGLIARVVKVEAPDGP